MTGRETWAVSEERVQAGCPLGHDRVRPRVPADLAAAGIVAARSPNGLQFAGFLLADSTPEPVLLARRTSRSEAV
jgi:hypothetical protein